MPDARPFKRTQILTTLVDIATRWWLVILPSAGGLMGTYAGYVTDALAPWAPASWLGLGLASALIVSVVAWVAVKIGVSFSQWNFVRKIAASAPAFNPLDSVFERRQIKLADFRNPFNAVHSNKTFLNCEIIGPGVLYIDGVSTVSDSSFVNCDCVAVREGATVQNVMVLRNAVIRGGTIYGATLLFPEGMVAMVNRQSPGMNWITSSPPSS